MLFVSATVLTGATGQCHSIHVDLFRHGSHHLSGQLLVRYHRLDNLQLCAHIAQLPKFFLSSLELFLPPLSLSYLVGLPCHPSQKADGNFRLFSLSVCIQPSLSLINLPLNTPDLSSPALLLPLPGSRASGQSL